MPTQSRKKAIQFGTDPLDRGAISRILRKGSYEIVFVHPVQSTIDSLNNSQSYSVTEIDNQGREVNSIVIDDYRGLNFGTQRTAIIGEIATADILTCGLSAVEFEGIAPMIAEGINARDPNETPQPLTVIAYSDRSVFLTGILSRVIEPLLNSELRADPRARVRYGNSFLNRMVVPSRPSDGLDVQVEEFCQWWIESRELGQQRHNLGLAHFDFEISWHLKRKIYTVDTGRLIAAYFAHRLGHEFIHTAIVIPQVAETVRRALGETSELICLRRGVNQQAQTAYVNQVINRFQNPALRMRADDIGRAPLSSLTQEQLLVEPMVDLASDDHRCDGLLKGSRWLSDL